jgi:hypothetical protein
MTRQQIDILLADNEYLRTTHEAYKSDVADMEKHYQAEVANLQKINKAQVKKLAILEQERKQADSKVHDIRPEWQKEETKADNYCRTCPQ